MKTPSLRTARSCEIDQHIRNNAKIISAEWKKDSRKEGRKEREKSMAGLEQYIYPTVLRNHTPNRPMGFSMPRFQQKRLQPEQPLGGSNKSLQRGANLALFLSQPVEFGRKSLGKMRKTVFSRGSRFNSTSLHPSRSANQDNGETLHTKVVFRPPKTRGKPSPAAQSSCTF